MARLVPVPSPAAREETHNDIARAWLAVNSVEGHEPVFANGEFYVPGEDGLWRSLPMEKVEVAIAELYNGLPKLCRRASDYAGIARHAAAIASDPQFFNDAAVGVVTPAGFHTLRNGGRVELEPLTLEHRQTFRLQWAPRPDEEPILFDRMLASAFAGDHEAEQTELVWQLIGGILFGLLVQHQVAVLLLGKEASGKSTLQRLIEAAFPPTAVSAVSPASWAREYNVAAMAGKRLNVVGELADDTPLPSAAFKNVTGGNLIEGRHPTHRPFYFTCCASHLFASNVLPPTLDRSDAFFRRWRIVRFANRVPEDQADPDLLKKIVAAEMPAILGKAFAAAGDLAAAGRVGTSPAHGAVMAKWKAAANPVLQFLLDDEWIELDPAAEGRATRDTYEAYRRWAGKVGMRNPFGRNHFLDLLDATGAGVGVAIRKTAKGSVVRGIRLLQSGIE